MSSVGSYLRELRQRRGVSLDELARVTRVGSRYLEALEADDHAALPAPVFTKGFIRAYCQALQQPPDEALARYGSDAAGGRPIGTTDGAAPRPGGTPAPTDAGPRPHGTATPAGVAARGERERSNRGTVLVSFVLLVILGLALFGVTLVLHAGREPATTYGVGPRPGGTPLDGAGPRPGGTPAPVGSPPSAIVSDGAPALGGSPAASSAQAKSSAPGAGAPPLVPPGLRPDFGRTTPSVLGAITTPYRLVARTSETTWLRVRMEDGRMTEETIPAGQVREWVSNTPFVLTVGNAGGVTLELNGRALPPLGERGAVISKLVVPPPPAQ
ncbi:MAG: helix-turn-helix domain-containing protein [Candidatus Rokubacteria bacterium]|nr:helix-turn-helix domain-containing protein [Candidatus Rokubacteria bacterium]